MKNSENTKTRHFLIILLLLLTANYVHAQSKKIIFSNNNQETNIEGNASINVGTGNITVTTQANKLIIDEQPAILGFYPDTYRLASFPDGITVNWTAAFAANCSASVPVGNASWTGSKAFQGDNQEVVTINSAGTTLQLDCTSLNGGPTVTKTFTIEQASTGGTTGDPVIDKFVLSNYPSTQTPTIPSDGQYTVEWQVSNLGSGNCSAFSSSLSHGGWTGVLASAVGSKSISISGEPVLTISCSNGGNPVSRTITITNSTGTVPVGCENITPPTGMTIAPVFDQTDPLSGGGQNNPIPGQHGYGAEFATLANQGVLFTHNNANSYVSIGNIYIPNDHANYFTKNGSRHLGASIFIGDPTTTYGPFNKAIYSMSTCPGDFDLTKTAICVGEVNKGSKFYVSTDPQNPFATGNGCVVSKNQTYYMNFFSGSGTAAINNPSLRECGGKGICGSIIQQGAASY